MFLWRIRKNAYLDIAAFFFIFLEKIIKTDICQNKDSYLELWSEKILNNA